MFTFRLGSDPRTAPCNPGTLLTSGGQVWAQDTPVSVRLDNTVLCVANSGDKILESTSGNPGTLVTFEYKYPSN